MEHPKKLGINTQCVHVGGVNDEQFKGAISPIYMSTSYAFFDGVDMKRYPRYLGLQHIQLLGNECFSEDNTEIH